MSSSLLSISSATRTTAALAQKTVSASFNSVMFSARFSTPFSATSWAKAGGIGGSAATDANLKGIKVYRITKTGVVLQATVSGTKYWKKHSWNER